MVTVRDSVRSIVSLLVALEGGLVNAISFGGVLAGPYYDAILHTVFVGFVCAMIFGHAPIILPAILNRMSPYHPTFYAPLVLLHGSLLLRGGRSGGMVARSPVGWAAQCPGSAPLSDHPGIRITPRKAGHHFCLPIVVCVVRQQRCAALHSGIVEGLQHDRSPLRP
jgi:hypothetical protein